MFFRKQYLIHGSEVREIIKQTFHTNRNIFISDRKYKLLGLGMLKMYLRFNQVNKIRYTSDEFDCDDFTMRLATDVRWWFRGSTFGIVWTGSHALNFFIDRDKKFGLLSLRRMRSSKSQKISDTHSSIYRTLERSRLEITTIQNLDFSR